MVRATTGLPLEAAPIVDDAKLGDQYVVSKSVVPLEEVVSRNVWSVLEVLPGDTLPRLFSALLPLVVTRHMSRKAIPVQVSRAESHEHRRHPQGIDVGSKLMALASPVSPSTTESVRMLDNGIKK